MTHTRPHHNTTTRLLAQIIRAVIADTRCTTVEELREAVEARCRELQLPRPRASLEAAIDVVGSNTTLLRGLERARPRAVAVDPTRAISRDEARDLLAGLYQACAKREAAR